MCCVCADGDDDGDGGMLRALLGDGDDEGGEDAGGRGGDGLRAQAALDALDDELDEGEAPQQAQLVFKLFCYPPPLKG